MRILVHDYPGHAFPVQLSRALAHRGHAVRHLCFKEFQAPKGPIERRMDDPAGFELGFLDLGEAFAKHSFAKRWVQERRLGALARADIARWRPDIVLAGNAPLDVQAGSLAGARDVGAGFVYWLQDLVGVAIRKILSKRMPVLGDAIGLYYEAMERRLLRAADAVVAITDDFAPMLRGWGVANIHTVENWAAREEIAVAPRDNAFARAHGLVGVTTFVYSGTLGMKHDPSLLRDLAVARPEARVLVISEGPGAAWLAAANLPNLAVLPFQPFEKLGETLASADVLVAVLESDAGIFSVPSKVLTYLCAGRPILAAIPPENLAARLIGRENAGFAVAPADRAGFLAAAKTLAENPDLRAAQGAKALDYARRTFDIAAIAGRFAAILESASHPRP
ncbi:MAG: glycosyltransferase family 4 protein [Tagaea sp.]|nr:glycosyltransferase family 4 protein [Magnetospirillum sp.]